VTVIGRTAASRWAITAAGLIVGAASLAILGLSDVTALAARPSTTVSALTRPVNHFNVGATHSPELLRQLAGPRSISRASAAATISKAKIAGAMQGIDVSSHQEDQAGGIDWADVAKSGIQFAAIKATEGDYYQNPYALNDLEAAKAAGLSVVAYAFAIPNGGGASASPVVQADDIISYLKSGQAGVPPIMLDIEYDPYKDGTNTCYGLNQKAMGAWVTAFAAEVKARTGQPVFVYTTTNWWHTCVGTSAALGSNPLWVAAYSTSSSPGTLPSGWSTGDWTIWQYSASGTVPGIDGDVDLDQLNPNVLSLLNPGDQQDLAGGGDQITPVQLRASQSATYSASGLPSGLSMTSSGQITGLAPATPGTSVVTITATSGTVSQSATFTWYWHGPLTVKDPGNLRTAVGSPVDLQVQVSGTATSPPVTFSAPSLSSADALPAGLSIGSSGRITGWTSTPGTYRVTLYAADGLEAAASTTFTWTTGVAPDTGPRGPVHLNLANKCLADPKASSAAGTVADIRTCNGKPAQEWTYAQDDSLRFKGMCLQSPGKKGSVVRLQKCTGQGDQQWDLVYPHSVAAAGTGAALALYNPDDGLCLSDPGNRKKNGTSQIVWSCDGSRGQEWGLPAGAIQSGIAGQCLDDFKNLTRNGNKVDLYRCDRAKSQSWAAEADGTIRIDDKCLDVHKGRTTGGTPVELSSCNGSTAEQWRLVDGDGALMLENPHSGLCLADPADSKVYGTQLQLHQCTTRDPGTVWRVS
jgi:GH25 family lysozyme M1 (1,4-beta-N-acetylmuramidase)